MNGPDDGGLDDGESGPDVSPAEGPTVDEAPFEAPGAPGEPGEPAAVSPGATQPASEVAELTPPVSEATPAPVQTDPPPSTDVAKPAAAEPGPAEPGPAEPGPAEAPAAEPGPAEAPAAEPGPAEAPAAEPGPLTDVAEAPEPTTETEPTPETETASAESAPAPVEAAVPPVPAPTAPDPAVASEPKIGDAAPASAAGPVAHPPVPQPRPATETGRIVEGLVTSVTSDAVELTLDDGRSAVIHRRNFGFNDEDPSAVLSVGDRCFGAELLREDPKSRVVLSRAWALKRQAWERVVEASEKNETLNGKVVSASAKGLVVDVGVRGFVPASHLELTAVTDVASYADQTIELRILEVDPRKEKLVLSRRSLLLRAQRKEMQELFNSLKKGDVRTGKVASLTDYGAFVDLGGISGLVHISELSWQRVGKPADVVTIGDEVEVKVLDVKPKKKRISLSLRQTAPDPLLGLEVGAVVTGRVSRLVDFGAFVAIGDAEGLVHLSELAEYRVVSPEEVVAPGDEVGVKILSVDRRRRRIELSIRRAAEYGG